MWAVWLIACAVVNDGYVIPSFPDTAERFFALLGSGGFWLSFAKSLGRTALSWAVSLLAAAALAFACAAFPRARAFAAPFVAVFRTVPMSPIQWAAVLALAVTPVAVCECAKTVIVEVNKNMPVCLGGFDNCIHIDDVDMIVEGENPILDELGGGGAASEVDLAVANLVVPEICDGACLQLGIGSMPNAIGKMIAESDLKDLGVHTEMYVDAFVDIARAGKITGKYKNLDKGRQVFAFGAGTQKLYDYVNHNPDVMGAPVDYTNDVHVIAQLDNFISINNAVDVDLYGQVSSESSGTHHISGAGGQQDFVMGAYLSKGGKSFICLSSTMTGKDGQLKSRIVPTLTNGSITTDPRSAVHYLVTEYGMVNLKGASTWERAEKIISIAHPDFRGELEAEFTRRFHCDF